MMRLFSSRATSLRICGRHYRPTALALAASSPPHGGGGGGGNHSAEDRADEERERKLRDQFAQKIMDTRIQQQQLRSAAEAKNPWQMFKAVSALRRAQMQQQGGSGGWGAGGNPGGSGAGAAPFAQRERTVRIQELLFRLFYYFTSIYAIILVYQLTDENSRFNLMRSVPWWTQPIDSMAVYLLIRHTLSRAQQSRIMDDYAAAKRLAPGLTLAQFVQQSSMHMFAGAHTQPYQIISAVVACIASTGDLRVANTIAQAVPSYASTADSIDRTMDALRQAYPGVVAPIAG